MKNRPAYLHNWPQVLAFRLGRHHLLDTRPAQLTALCQDVCGFQCQVMTAAETAVWARNHRLKRSELHAALWQDHTLVKTALMRGTLHLITTADFPLYISALRACRFRETLRIMARYGVTEKEARAVKDAVMDTLAAGPLARRELTERVLSLKIVGKKGRPWYEQSAWGVARLPIIEGRVCYGPTRGQEVTFIRTDQWLPKLEPVPEDMARKILLRRYLAAYGPATPRDFSSWTSFRMEEAKAVWASLGDELVQVSIEGAEAWMLREDYPRLVESHPMRNVVRLLPGFDPYMLSHAEKNHLVDSRWYKKVYHAQWWITPVILLNGRVIGTWDYRRRKRACVEKKLFEKVSREIQAKIDEESASLEDFLAG